MDFTVSMILPFVSAALGAYFGAYLTEKGKNHATREDIAQITRVTEQIKDQISNESWDRQRRWDTQRIVMFDLVKALTDASRILSAMLSTFRATTGDDDFDDLQRKTYQADARRKWMDADDALDQAVALAGLVSSQEVHLSLVDVSREMKALALDALAGKDPELSAPAVLKKVYGIMASVRRELGLGNVRVDSSTRKLDSK